MSRRIAVVTLGCEKNLVDSEVMSGLMSEKGYTLTADAEDADVIVVNTCAFIDAAKQESIDTILQMAKLKDGTKKTLLVAGCMAQRYADELLAEIPEIDGVVGTGEFTRIHELTELAQRGERPKFVGNPVYIYDQHTPRVRQKSQASAYVKIAEGCDHQCTFCVIPQMRGAFRSRSIESIVAEVEHLVADGVREVNLIAQDSTQFGMDLYGKRNLPELLRALQQVEGLAWIRLHYAYPAFFTDELIEAFRSLDKVVKYVDMPLQHAQDHILRSMQRPGRQRHIRELVAKMRERIPGVVLRSSFIVGFPGETETDFEALKAFVQELAFDHVGVFTYSAEEGATSSEFPDQVDQDVKERRASELMEVARIVAAKRLERFIGSVVPVLIEGADDAANASFIGRTSFDAREIDGVVYVKGDGLTVGSIIPVRITHAFDFDLVGEAV
ncbi:30S ribosomal protein S12 methylthiotransferase RimO [Ferroacidibacillus organovorans]|uniref:Ribosomal protein uS12 methylthiotransferase RimO n=1 Tax=Ferroacidibacillus organovorans TaxID=1765683 RepID=A0A162RZC9_9BACL|nr:30S ribosomal protein S12 methylthiotransferase RimO [Ferroacidibacillus organovorans]KYP79387.1 ribosomal protein S12 methylthiotransferase RimO [Ferroacidibacillus organovorans]OAG90179.1 ribosomal protein S12 methylthiotransferase RimO [Ferroacidibacillus organovorans]OPG15733.1 ribosomal protein S12 methylthiotransferase RimO [Ferroacidibacillus organovorans]